MHLQHAVGMKLHTIPDVGQNQPLPRATQSVGIIAPPSKDYLNTGVVNLAEYVCPFCLKLSVHAPLYASIHTDLH